MKYGLEFILALLLAIGELLSEHRNIVAIIVVVIVLLFAIYDIKEH